MVVFAELNLTFPAYRSCWDKSRSFSITVSFCEFSGDLGHHEVVIYIPMDRAASIILPYDEGLRIFHWSAIPTDVTGTLERIVLLQRK